MKLMAKKVELKERGTNEIMYPVTTIDSVIGLQTELSKLDENINNLSDHLDRIASEEAIMNLLAYGVEWDINVADPHLTRVGNISMHKTLPIQSQLRGCIAQGGKIMYWLNENDWTRKKDPVKLPFTLGIDPDTMDSTITVNPSDLADLRPNDLIIIIFDNSRIPIARVNVSRFNLGVLNLGPANEVVTSVEIGARLDGYDGTVRVYCPSFYIKSFINENKRKVLISPHRISNTWIHLPALLIDAYRSTVLNAVPEDMGYLSTLPVGSAISVVNTSAYCRGGNNRNTFDKYLTGADGVDIDIFRTDLGKPRTLMSRAVMRNYSRNSGSEMLSYDQYKNIFYWLYVIEYANFNSLEAYNEELTSEGFRQGGMGAGVTNYANWSEYNNYFPLTPCGYCNSIGNGSGVVLRQIQEYNMPIGEYLTLNNANLASNNGTSTKVDGKIVITSILNTTNSVFYTVWNTTSVKTTYRVTGLTESGETIRFEVGSGSSLFQAGTLSEDGEIEITWPANLGNREFRFSEVKSDVNITVEIVSAEAGFIPRAAQTLNVPRWRGFDNPFGDIWTNLDGVLIDTPLAGASDTSILPTCYIITDPKNYTDSLTGIEEKATRVVKQCHDSGYIKEWALGDAADMVPGSVGGNTTQYKCDYYWVNYDDTPETLLVGGRAIDGAAAGLGSFYSNLGVSHSIARVGFRSVSSFLSFPENE